MKTYLIIFLIALGSQASSAPITTTPAPDANKTVPYNGSYNGNYTYPKPSYYENGIPVYTDINYDEKRREAARRKAQSRDNFPHYQGVIN